MVGMGNTDAFQSDNSKTSQTALFTRFIVKNRWDLAYNALEHIGSVTGGLIETPHVSVSLVTLSINDGSNHLL